MKNYLIILISVVLFTHCKEEPPKPESQTPIDKRDNFIGKYRVISESPNYFFTCGKFDTLGNQTWVRLHNICNLFDMEFLENQNAGFSNQLTGIPVYFPIVDKFHNRWSFQVYGNDSIRNVNRIVNDTFRMYYRLHNTPWHNEDDTAYMDKKFLMVAVREH